MSSSKKEKKTDSGVLGCLHRKNRTAFTLLQTTEMSCKKLQWLPVSFGLNFKILSLFHKCYNRFGPSFVSGPPPTVKPHSGTLGLTCGTSFMRM